MTSPEGLSTESERWAECADGRRFAKAWHPHVAKSSTPIVLFHESLGCVELWKQFPRLLANRVNRPVIAYDRLGYGRSDRHAGKQEPEFISAESRAGFPGLRNAFGFDDFVVCGHSVGGGMAIEIAAAYSASCRGVITISSHAFVEQKTVDGVRDAERHFKSPQNFAKLTQYHGDKAEWVLDAWISAWLSPQIREWTLDAALEKVVCPILAIHGEYDEYGSNSQAERIAGSRGILRLLPTGHVPHRENPELLLDVIAPFIEAIR